MMMFLRVADQFLRVELLRMLTPARALSRARSRSRVMMLSLRSRCAHTRARVSSALCARARAAALSRGSACRTAIGHRAPIRARSPLGDSAATVAPPPPRRRAPPGESAAAVAPSHPWVGPAANVRTSLINVLHRRARALRRARRPSTSTTSARVRLVPAAHAAPAAAPR